MKWEVKGSDHEKNEKSENIFLRNFLKRNLYYLEIISSQNNYIIAKILRIKKYFHF